MKHLTILILLILAFQPVFGITLGDNWEPSVENGKTDYREIKSLKGIKDNSMEISTSSVMLYLTGLIPLAVVHWFTPLATAGVAKVIYEAVKNPPKFALGNPFEVIHSGACCNVASRSRTVRSRDSVYRRVNWNLGKSHASGRNPSKRSIRIKSPSKPVGNFTGRKLRRSIRNKRTPKRTFTRYSFIPRNVFQF